MRMVSSKFRQIKHCTLITSSHSCPGLARSRPFASGGYCHQTGVKRRLSPQTRRYVTTALATEQHALSQRDLEAPYLKAESLPPRLGYYGKWQRLSVLHDQLAYEADVATPIGANIRLVDLPENANDIHLWSCILNFRHRRDGVSGVGDVLRGIYDRKSLHTVSGTAAEAFWRLILVEAVREKELLDTVWGYAEWLWEKHGTRWPKLYVTIVSYFISSQQVDRALMWHFRLSPNFALTLDDFTEFMKQDLANPDPVVQDTLGKLYVSSIHRTMYDELIPYLYEHGAISIARQWRQRLIRNFDMPLSRASQDFLRFLSAYFPQDTLTVQERSVLGMEGVGAKGNTMNSFAEHVAQDSDPHHFINRIHGETFGIREKTYNDGLTARWFATSWVSLDLAIHMVRMLGVDRIGPLSLQSVALREHRPAQVLRRIKQLESAEISIGTSSYARAVRYLATVNDAKTLADLLHCDIHPDVFDDWDVQQQILQSSTASGDWKKYRLILAVRLAVTRDHATRTSNYLITACLAGDKQGMVLNVLDDMRARGLEISPSASHAVSMHILTHVSRHADDAVDLGFYVALCRHFTTTEYPLATQAVRTIILRLLREGRLRDADRLSMEIVRYYKTLNGSLRKTLNIHKQDVPDSFKEDKSDGHDFQLIPRDLDLKHPLHPIQLIFDRKLQSNIIRWGARWSLLVLQNQNTYSRNPVNPEDFGFARGVRLLAMLRDHGVAVRRELLRTWITHRLAELYGTTASDRRIGLAKLRNQLSLEEARALCEEAWRPGAAHELLPPLSELKEKIKDLGIEKTNGWFDYMDDRSLPRPRRKMLR